MTTRSTWRSAGAGALRTAGAGALLAGALVALVALPARAGPVAAAADVSWGTPSATSTFGSGIEFRQPIKATGLNPRYVEILLNTPGDAGTSVRTISEIAPGGSTVLEYSLLESDGHLYPNTRFAARWRVTDQDGTRYLGPILVVTYTDTRFAWKTATGALVRVYWYEGDDAFGQRALRIGEAGVARTEELLGVTETDPIDFYVYADQAAFYAALGPGTRENVGGTALSGIRTLFALITPDQINESWVSIVIPHELTHLVFATATRNPYHSPPRWLNEGLAVYLSGGYDARYRLAVAEATGEGSLIPLSGLAGRFPTARDKFVLAYAESVSAVDFMVRRFGGDALVKLIRSYATGVTDAEAFTAVLGVDAAEFNAAWLADIGAKQPVAHGPQPDPVGPLPPGWTTVPEVAQAPVGSPPAPSGAVSPAVSATPAAAGSSGPATAGPSSGASPGATPTTVAAASGNALSPTLAALPASPAGRPATDGDAGLGMIVGIVAVLMAAAGLGLLAFRRRPASPR